MYSVSSYSGSLIGLTSVALDWNGSYCSYPITRCGVNNASYSNEEFKPQALSAYETHQKQSVHAFLHSLAMNPGEFKAGIRQ